MPPEVIGIVLAAALLHASWNALAKGRGGDPLIGAVVIAVGSATVSLAVLAWTGWPAAASWPYVIASGLIHVGYFVLLGLSYRYADYTAVYPLMRGSAPLLTTVLGFLVLGETLSRATTAGVALLSAGVLGLGAQAMLRGGLDGRSLALALGNVGIIVAYTLIDGVGARASGNPAAYATAMMLITGVLLGGVVALWKPGEMARTLRRDWLFGLAGGAMVMASYGAALWAMTRAPIGAVAALRETSVLFGTMIGAVFMGERASVVRVIAAAAIVGGLALMRGA